MVSAAPGPVGMAATGSAQTLKAEFKFSLNMGTLLGHKLGLVKEVEVASKAGYAGIEPWISAIDEYVKQGGDLKEMRKRIEDAGLTVEGGIGFPEWIVEDEGRRAKGVERAKREMDLLGQIGGKRLAVPPAGATDVVGLDLGRAAERYRVLLEAGDSIGVVPQLELWGFSKCLNRLSQCVTVALETGHPKACVLADIYHLHKGGSGFQGLRMLSSGTMQVFHMNDFPAEPPRAKIDDSFRVFPGDGVAPLKQVMTDLRGLGGQIVLSLELFNREYWKRDALEVAKEGLDKMKAAAALAG